jgi:peptidoglycan-associated lipoprotein
MPAGSETTGAGSFSSRATPTTRGTGEYNIAVGERRATSTRNFLVSRGVAADRITIVSYGEERPLCSAQTEACWAQNRRAMFLTKER